MFRRGSRLWFVLLVVWCVARGPHAFAQPAPVTGTVVDVAGLAVSGAEVTGRTPDGQTTTVTTGPDGSFTLAGPVASLRVVSPGFSTVDFEPPTGEVQVVLRPATFADSVVVTATRGAERLPSAASATVVTAAELSNISAGSLDDVLRNTPGFSLFRRNSSRVANPKLRKWGQVTFPSDPAAGRATEK